MNRFPIFSILLATGSIAGCHFPICAQSSPRFKHVASKAEIQAREVMISKAAEQIPPLVDSTMLRVRTPEEIFSEITLPDDHDSYVNLLSAPWVFSGYHSLSSPVFDFPMPVFIPGMKIRNGNELDSVVAEENGLIWPDMDFTHNPADSISLPAAKVIEDEIAEQKTTPAAPADILPIVSGDVIPRWLSRDMENRRMQQNFIYQMMVDDPSTIDFAYWQLPDPPVLADDDVSFNAFIRKLDLPEIDPDKAVIIENKLGKVHWLHTFNSGLQMSQAFLSPNWYQGGNNNFSFLFNFNWNVALNTVYHPNLIFTSNLSYKLGFYSNPKHHIRKFSISDDVFQYNLNAGVKAFNNWFYSFNMLFKTQLLNNYEQNSDKRTASFLSPGELNMGIGMTYSKQNKAKTFKLSLAISPLSYNLKTCIDHRLDETQFKIKKGHRSVSQFGSNCETTVNWDITSNINLKSRLFLFTDYDYFLSDWENTVSFAINRFLSTQIYLYMRYDTSSPSSSGWKHFMMKEILSFGLSYTFNTKPS